MSWEFERYYIGGQSVSSGYTISGSRFVSITGKSTTDPVVDGYIREDRWDGQGWVEYSRITLTAVEAGATYSQWFSTSIAAPSADRVVAYCLRNSNNSLSTLHDAMVWKRVGGIWELEATIPLYYPISSAYSTAHLFTLDESEIRCITAATTTDYTYFKLTRTGAVWSSSSTSLTYTPLATVKNARHLVHNGRDVICTGASTLTGNITWSGFAYWDSRTDYEHLTSGYNFDNGVYGLGSVSGYSINPFDVGFDHTNVHACCYYNKIYILAKNSIIQADAELYIPEGIIATVPQTASSNICVVKNKIYVSGLEQNGDETQNLWIYNLTTGIWTSVVLPGRHQILRRHIIDGLDGSVWITNRNNHSIIRVGIETDTVLATVRVNRHPYRLSVNQSKELFVASDAIDGWIPRKFYDPRLVGGTVGAVGGGQIDGIAGTPYKIVDTEDVTDGMITTINQADNSQVNLGAARCNGYSSDSKYWDPSTIPTDKDFFDDGQGYIWFMTDGQIGRLKKADLELKTTFSERESTGTSAQYNMVPDNGTITRFWPEVAVDSTLGATETGTIMSSLVTPPIHYQRYENGVFVDYNVKPYIFIVTATGLVYAARCSALVRKNKYIVRGTAMISIGDQTYYGE